MLSNFNSTLLDLELAFQGNIEQVVEKTGVLNKQLQALKDVKKKSIEKTNLTDMISLIEKLSIQNEYKLNLIKEFPDYIASKK